MSQRDVNFKPEMQRGLILSSPSPACLESSRVQVGVQLWGTRVQVQFQQVASLSLNPGVCGSSLNPRPSERNFANSSPILVSTCLVCPIPCFTGSSIIQTVAHCSFSSAKRNRLPSPASTVSHRAPSWVNFCTLCTSPPSLELSPRSTKTNMSMILNCTWHLMAPMSAPAWTTASKQLKSGSHLMACRSIQTYRRPSSSEPVPGKEPHARSTPLQSALIPLLCPRASVVLASRLTVWSHSTITLMKFTNQYATTPGDCVTSGNASSMMTPNKSQLLWCRSDLTIATRLCTKRRNQTSLNFNACKTVWLVSSPELENVIKFPRY